MPRTNGGLERELLWDLVESEFSRETESEVYFEEVVCEFVEMVKSSICTIGPQLEAQGSVAV